MFIPPAYQIRKTLMQYLTKVSVSSKYRVEPESIKSNNNDILNWLSIIRNITPSFESVSYNLHAPIWMAFRKRGVTFLICFRKRGVPRKGRSLRKWGEVPTLEETMQWWRNSFSPFVIPHSLLIPTCDVVHRSSNYLVRGRRKETGKSSFLFFGVKHVFVWCRKR